MARGSKERRLGEILEREKTSETSTIGVASTRRERRGEDSRIYFLPPTPCGDKRNGRGRASEPRLVMQNHRSSGCFLEDVELT